MSWELKKYCPPDFTLAPLSGAPDCVLAEAPLDTVAPPHFHAMSIFPEYFRIGGRWLLAEESRMDCVPVYEDGRIAVREFRLLKKGDLVVTGRTEDGSEGIYVHPNGFREAPDGCGDVFAFRRNRSRETAFSRDYDELYDLLRHEREHGRIVWVMGPAFAFDYDARNAFSRIANMLLRGENKGVFTLEGTATEGLTLGDGVLHEEFYPTETAVFDVMNRLYPLILIEDYEALSEDESESEEELFEEIRETESESIVYEYETGIDWEEDETESELSEAVQA